MREVAAVAGWGTASGQSAAAWRREERTEDDTANDVMIPGDRHIRQEDE